ncbi:MAG: hypothetical protein JW782_06955, partial [Candidatus Saganbacteria bacterium]|nr:hypothetical protein [Candidatus Saganbacteria bacterium]
LVSAADITRNWNDPGQSTALGRTINDTGGSARLSGTMSIPSPSGGSLATWGNISTSTYIYLQSFDASGHALWPEPVKLSTGYASSQSMAVDASGNIFVAWNDIRSGDKDNTDIYIQKISSSGVKQWTDGGLGVCALTSNQTNVKVVADGSGGAIVAWSDNRSTTYTELYAQRVKSSGSNLWTNNGVAVVTSNNAIDVQILSDGASGAFMAWSMYTDANSAYDIYAIRVNAADGSPATGWQAGGTRITAIPQNQERPQIISDGGTGCFIAWLDYRSASYNEVYIQRLNSDGTVYGQWAAGGEKVANSDITAYEFTLAESESNNCLVLWPREDQQNWQYDIYAQKVNGLGTSQWPSSVISASLNNEQISSIVTDGAGGAILTYLQTDPNTGLNTIYAQRLNSSGSGQWGSGGKIMSVPATGINQSNAVLSVDNIGGAFVAWTERAGSKGSETYDILSNHLDSNGNLTLTTQTVDNGEVPVAKKRPVCVNSEDPATASNMKFGVVWEDYRTFDSKSGSSYAGLYGQVVNMLGKLQWDTAGLGTSGSADQQYFMPSGCRTSDDNFLEAIAVLDSNNAQQVIVSQKVSFAGVPYWSKPINVVANGLYHYSPAVCSAGDGGAIYVWFTVDNTFGYLQVFSKACDSDGLLKDGQTAASPGLLLSENNDAFPSIAYIGPDSTGTKTGWVVWEHQDSNGISNLRVQQTSGTISSAKWGSPFIFSSVNNQLWPDIDKSGVREAVVVWSEKDGSNYVIKAQKIGYAGASGATQPTETAPVKLWADDIAVSQTNVDAVYPSVSVLPNGAITVFWQAGTASWDNDKTTNRPVPSMAESKVYLQVLTPDGMRIFSNDIEVCPTAGAETPVSVPAGEDSVVVTWNEETVVKAQLFGSLPFTTTTTTTTTQTTASTTTTTTVPIGVLPRVDRVSKDFAFKPSVATRSNNTIVGQYLQSGGSLYFTNTRTGARLDASNVQVAADGLSATFALDLSPGQDIGYYNATWTNPGGGLYTKNNALLLELSEGLSFFPTRMTEKNLSTSAPDDQPRIAYTLSEDKSIDIYIYDVRSMRVVFHRKFTAGAPGGKLGYNEILWDGSSDLGGKLPNGSYIVQAFANGKMFGQTYFVVTN